MKTLFWFCKELYIGNIQESTRIKKLKDKVSDETIDEKNCCMAWITVESKEDIKYFEDFYKDLHIQLKEFKTKKIVIFPFAHLSSKIPEYKVSLDVLNKLVSFIGSKDKMLIVKRAHFGSNKDIKFYSPSNPYQVMFRSYPLEGFTKDYYETKLK